MNVLVVGDVHGCYYTFEKLVNKHWNPDNEYLIQVGDLINKGKHSALCVKYARKLEKKYPYQVFFLKGNHEARFLKYQEKPGKSQTVDKTVKDFTKHELNPKKTTSWLQSRPLKWETPYMLITHGGISERVKNPYSNTNQFGVLFNRSPLKDVGKLQVFGHVIQNDDKMVFYGNSNAWCIDTGVWTGNHLSAMRLSYKGDVIDHIQVKSQKEDLTKRQLKKLGRL